ncbi:MAG: HEPN domain-containing protein [Ilumatobacteraceae bacterium]
MSALRDALSHLAKADEFLLAAETSLDQALFNAATSNAVVSGINAKDAICLKLTGVTGKADSHSSAVEELSKTGKLGRELAPTLSRLLQLKTKSQYQSATVAQVDAMRAVEWARRMRDAAAGIVRS